MAAHDAPVGVTTGDIDVTGEEAGHGVEAAGAGAPEVACEDEEAPPAPPTSPEALLPAAHAPRMTARLRKRELPLLLRTQPSVLEGLPVTVRPANVRGTLWALDLHGEAGSPFAGGTFRAWMWLDAVWPFAPPLVQLDPRTPLFHPNVSPDGDVCLDALKAATGTGPAAAHAVGTVEQLVGLLRCPNAADPLNDAAARAFDAAAGGGAEAEAAVALIAAKVAASARTAAGHAEGGTGLLPLGVPAGVWRALQAASHARKAL